MRMQEVVSHFAVCTIIRTVVALKLRTIAKEFVPTISH
jgi:hypothetical protein